jgi:hypothetical protein
MEEPSKGKWNQSCDRLLELAAVLVCPFITTHDGNMPWYTCAPILRLKNDDNLCIHYKQYDCLSKVSMSCHAIEAESGGCVDMKSMDNQ